MKKPRNKKYNPSKTANSFYKSALKDKAVIFITDGRGAHLVNLRTGRQYLPVAETAKVIENLTTKWCVLCAVFLKDQNNKNYASYYLNYWDKPRRQSQIAVEAEAVHQKLLKSCNSTHFVNLGWIAVPHMFDFTEEQANAIFEQAGAWERQAVWETQNDKETTEESHN